MIKWYCEQWIRADSCIGESRDYMSRWSEEGGVSHTVPPFPPIHPLHCSTALYCTVLALRWSARLSKCSAPSWLTSPWAWWSPSSRVCQQVGQEVQADEYCPAAPAEWRLVSWVEVASLHSPLLSSQCRITWLATPRTSQTSHTLTLQHSAPEPEPVSSVVLLQCTAVSVKVVSEDVKYNLCLRLYNLSWSSVSFQIISQFWTLLLVSTCGT